MPIRGANPLVRAPDKTITFTGAANFGQAGTSVTVYTITGRVLIVYFPPPFCTTNLGEAAPTATVALTVPSIAGLWMGATSSVNIDQDEWWDATADGSIVAGAGKELQAANGINAISENIVIVCATQNTNAGVLVFQGLHYIPLTEGATLT